MSDKLKVSKVESKGYGVIYKLPMLDRDLDVVAKAFYAYLCSFAGQGETAFPGIDKICYDLNISKSRLERHRKTLVDKGYITVKQIKEKGRFARNEYHINKDLAPYTQNEPTENEPTQNEPTQNEGINNNSINNNSINNNINNKKDSMSENKFSDVAELIKFYKELENLPKFIKMTDKRKSHINARITDYGLEKVKEGLTIANNSVFLKQALEKGEKWYSVDFIFNPNKFTFLLEGKYDYLNNNEQAIEKGYSKQVDNKWGL